MCDDSKTPHLRTYSIRHMAPNDVWLIDKVRAQGFRFDDNALVLWRRIEAGSEQIIGHFEASSVFAVFEDAEDLPFDTSVPDSWAKTYGTKKKDTVFASTPPPPSDDDVPF